MKTEIHLPVAELKQALPGFNKVMSKGTTLPALHHLRIQRDPDGEILIHATNLDDFASVRLAELQPGTPTDVLVPFETLARFTKASSPKDGLRLLPGESESVLVYPLGNTIAEQKIPTMLPEEWPMVPVIDSPAITLEDHFKAVLRTALDCASIDESRHVLQGACLDVTEKDSHYVVGTDGRHLFSANSFAFDLNESLIIPSRKFLGWSGFVQDGPWKLSQMSPTGDKPGWIRIESDKWTFMTRQIEGKYPNWRLPFPDPKSKKTTVLLEDEAVEFLLSIIPKLPTDPKNQAITLTVEEAGRFIVQGKAAENDHWTSIPVEKVQVTGIPTTVSINRLYLIKALKLGLKELQLRDAATPLVISSGGQRLLIAPINVSQSPPPRSPQQPVSTAPPPPPQQQPAAESQTGQSMKTANRIEPTQNNDEISYGDSEQKEKVSALRHAAEQVEKIRDALKAVVSDLAEVLKVITQAQKEKRATEKEIESIRESLRALQKVKI